MIRTYVEGDEVRLVGLFNENLPGGLARTTSSWLWRYVRNPHFDPNGVIVAEENGEIKGYLIGTVRQLFKGQTATGVIGDDFCVSHEERGKGIGKLLLHGLMDFAEEKHALLMVYEGKGNVAHQLCSKLDWLTVEEFAIVRRSTEQGEDAQKAMLQNQTSESSGGRRTVRRCRREDVDEVVAFLNLANREKMGSPQLTSSEYAWRYLTHTNSSLDSIFLSEQNGKIVGHVAVTFHPSPREGEQRTAVLGEPRGAISEILESLPDLKASRVSVAVSNPEIAYYEARGFSRAANGVVVVKNYTDLPVSLSQGAASWYLFSESILGEP